jgi:hypothetical protein
MIGVVEMATNRRSSREVENSGTLSQNVFSQQSRNPNEIVLVINVAVVQFTLQPSGYYPTANELWPSSSRCAILVQFHAESEGSETNHVRFGHGFSAGSDHGRHTVRRHSQGESEIAP